MPKVPYKPDPRPPRNRTVYKPPVDSCGTCLGSGKLTRHDESVKTEIDCWVCKGTGEQLPPPPEGDLHSDGSSIAWATCAKCRGRGVVYIRETSVLQSCPKCGGTGKL